MGRQVNGGARPGDEGELATLRRLVDVTRRLVGEVEVNEAITIVAQAGIDLLGGDAAVVALTDDGASTATAVTIGVEAHLHDQAILPFTGLHGRVLESGRAMVLDDYDTWDDAVEDFVGLGYHAAVAAPIPSDAGVVGVLSVWHRNEATRVSDAHIATLAALAEHAGAVIVRARGHMELSAERRRFEALLHTLPDGLAVVEGGLVTAWNAGAEELTGLAAGNVVGRPPPLDLTADERIRVSDGTGATRWVDAVSRPLAGDEGAVWLLRDVTQQERLEQARNLFLATTSHELKTPLTVVKGLAITLRRHWDRLTHEQRTEALETIERRTLHLDRLVERVLVGSRVEAGVMDFHLTPVSLEPCLSDVLEGFAAVAPLHELIADVPEDFPLVAADRQALDTVLGHLVDNAIKYSPRGGKVTVTAREDGTTSRISVCDEGEGLQQEFADLLRPFTQGERHTTRRVAGVGLGLYIVQRLVSGMHGELSASNRRDGGAEFTFTLPVWEDKSGPVWEDKRGPLWEGKSGPASDGQDS